MQHSNVHTAKSNDIDHWLRRSRRERTGLWTIMSEVCPLKPTQTLLAVLDSPRRVWYCLCCLLRNVCPLKPLGQTILDPLQSQQSYSEIPFFEIDFSAVLDSPRVKKIRCWDAVQRYQTQSGHRGPTPTVRGSRLKRCLWSWPQQRSKGLILFMLSSQECLSTETVGSNHLRPTPVPTILLRDSIFLNWFLSSFGLT